ncbi:hypothetical protein JRO89_XS11G0111900 [Xanthoceras sorbifolium]|uniref:Uncharacterized protein n=1 Tax=Xanthoceras sorbifolium TaxID=99658 RepID=A0ABQ8HF94_9ROSI|nr:hypothetical protein JRO89_XS11G0111900 [Xanthoceras sorbifolium]
MDPNYKDHNFITLDVPYSPEYEDYVSAESSEMAPASAPSMLTGAGFSLPVRVALCGFLYSLFIIYSSY